MGIYNRVGGTDGVHYGINNFMVGNTGNDKIGSRSYVYNGLANQFGFHATVLGGGTNYGAYLTATGGNANWAVYAAAGKSYFSQEVGIGTTSPSYMLDVSGSANASWDVYAGNSIGVGTTSPSANVGQGIHVPNGKILVGDENGILADLTVNTDGTQEIFRGRVNGTTNVIIDANGFMGIGDQSPSERLEVDGNANFKDSVYVGELLGVGTTTPTYTVEVASDLARAININNSYTGASPKYGAYATLDAEGTGTRYGFYAYVNGNASDASSSYGMRGYATTAGPGNVYGGYFATGTATGGGTEYGVYASASDYGLYVAAGQSYFNSTGITVGTTTQATGYMVSVNGDIICEELKVQDSGSWPDYVFASDYDLRSLEEIEAHIEANSHLPGVPDAATVAEEGIEIGRMQKLLMEKIEELTLYMIDANKQIVELKNEVKELKNAK
jgi:hypothetical protein